MEAAAVGIIAGVWAVWIVGIIRLVRLKRTGLALLAFLLPGVGNLIALYGLFASPRHVALQDRYAR
jgi:hypothetical protein